ncbi:hypothetical protein K435DRAFT_789930 [Dendrothele bispora CBS 962.96]|uniref:Uncharacterized protein n=1 Tax=Dendrothele bispora (strain CBS 962.96) TaxID=1314807 RepID=A0A4S8MSS4_DENBC|nr:hypothetical protein K435DRAFT_789930 [Dendrothele bispora CBS 962.96]
MSQAHDICSRNLSANFNISTSEALAETQDNTWRKVDTSVGMQTRIPIDRKETVYMTVKPVYGRVFYWVTQALDGMVTATCKPDCRDRIYGDGVQPYNTTFLNSVTFLIKLRVSAYISKWRDISDQANHQEWPLHHAAGVGVKMPFLNLKWGNDQ